MRAHYVDVSSRENLQRGRSPGASPLGPTTVLTSKPCSSGEHGPARPLLINGEPFQGYHCLCDSWRLSKTLGTALPSEAFSTQFCFFTSLFSEKSDRIVHSGVKVLAYWFPFPFYLQKHFPPWIPSLSAPFLESAIEKIQTTQLWNFFFYYTAYILWKKYFFVLLYSTYSLGKKNILNSGKCCFKPNFTAAKWGNYKNKCFI